MNDENTYPSVTAHLTDDAEHHSIENLVIPSAHYDLLCIIAQERNLDFGVVLRDVIRKGLVR